MPDLGRARPRGLSALTLLMCLLNLSGFLMIDSRQAVMSVVGLGAIAVVSFIVCFSFVVLYFFWMGRNWARILVFLTSGVAILNLLTFTRVPRLTAAIEVVEASVAFFLVVWLTRPPVVAYFKRLPASPTEEGSR